MDYKVFRTAVLAIVSALFLVLVIVYATNADKINAIFGKSGVSGEDSSAVADTSIAISGYGEQIGDDTQAFLHDESFFDEKEEIHSAVVIKKSENSDEESSLLGSSSEAEKNDDDEEKEAIYGELENPDVTEDSFNDYIAPDSVVGTY